MYTYIDQTKYKNNTYNENVLYTTRYCAKNMQGLIHGLILE